MIIGITGRAGSGKSTVARNLVAHYGFVEVGLADMIKRICRDVFAFTDEQLWGPSEKRNAPDMRYRRISPSAEKLACVCGQSFRDGEDFRDHMPCDAAGPVFLTPRHALQQLGTEWGRACYPDVWIDHALRVATSLLGGHHYYTPTQGLITDCGASIGGVVIPDIRFPNEAAAIKAAGGRIWKTQFGSGLEGAAGAHVSEQHIDKLPFDVLVPVTPLDEMPALVARLLGEP